MPGFATTEGRLLFFSIDALSSLGRASLWAWPWMPLIVGSPHCSPFSIQITSLLAIWQLGLCAYIINVTVSKKQLHMEGRKQSNEIMGFVSNSATDSITHSTNRGWAPVVHHKLGWALRREAGQGTQCEEGEAHRNRVANPMTATCTRPSLNTVKLKKFRKSPEETSA